MEARIAGINVPINKHIDVALTSIFGIGRERAREICKSTNVPTGKKIKDLTEAELDSLRSEISKYTVEGELRREIAMNIKRKMDIGSYEGLRHRRGLPLKQRTRTNARTRKGKRKGKKA